ncbi:MAG: aldo/keto reductase [bacterium]|nr:aldo/keto reductase [bacterium]
MGHCGNYRHLGRTEYKISRIGLGTAEIGFAYGIGSRSLPTEEEAENILNTAVDLGITYFDTANFYQLAEERIGRSGIAKIKGVLVGTKCGQFLEQGELLEPLEIQKRIEEQVEDSLRKLQLDSLPLLYLHGGSRGQIESGLLIDILQNLKDKGKIRYTGISTRGEEAPLAAVRTGFFDVIQVAYSILDQRMAKEVLAEAHRNNIGVINRSVLLKGSLTPLVHQLPPSLEKLKEHSAIAEKIAKKHRMSLPQLAICFVASENRIASSLIGTNKVGHLKAAVNAASPGPLWEEILSQLRLLAIDDPRQVDPAHWPPLSS